MATRLKDTDVVIIGARRGWRRRRAAARAGGHRGRRPRSRHVAVAKRDFAPDELRNNFAAGRRQCRKRIRRSRRRARRASSPTPRGGSCIR